MLGIAHREQIDFNSIKKGHLYAVPTKWTGFSGRETYENETLSVASDSCIYNSRELFSLTGRETENDATLIALLYAEFGIELFKKLQGPFSISIIDKRLQKLLVATDRFGIKPIVYYSDGVHFIYGSRIRDIFLLPQAPPDDIDCEALIDYVNLSAIPTPKTVYKNIKKLPPGHFLEIKKDNLLPILNKYYDIDYSISRRPEEYFLERIPLQINSSISTILEYELSKDHKIGAFLSGGTDSSTVTGIIKKLTGAVRTFSIGFDEPGYNELGYARIASRHFGSEHNEYMVTPDDVLNTLDVITDVYDEPFGNASAVPTYFCACLAREQGIDTLLAGDGGDEIFGGNERYASDKIFSFYHKVPCSIRKWLLEPSINCMPSYIKLVDKGKKYIRRANIPQPDRFFSYNPVMALGREAIFSPEILRRVNGYDPLSWAKKIYGEEASDDELNRLLYLDMKFTITDNDLRKVTSMSEKAGINVAYPFLDNRLVDFAAAIPGDLKVKGRYLRYIFKKALKDFLPQEVITKKKHGFGLPIGVWIRTNDNISSLVRDTLLHTNCLVRPYFRDGFIKDLFKQHEIRGAAFYGDIIWLLLILELWMRKRQTAGSGE